MVAPGSGPTLAGIALDDAALRRAIVEPDAEIAVGYRNVMPAYDLDDAELDALVEDIRTLPEVTEEPFEAMWPLALCCIAFVLFHFVFSALRVRLVESMGEGAYMGLYSLPVGIAFAGIFWAWGVAPFVPLWNPPRFTTHLAVTLMLFALFFLVAGYTTKSPTVAGMAKVAKDPPTGIVTVTRHPALWGFTIWAFAHLGANGDLRSLILFGSFAVLSIGGMLHIDARRRAALGEEWEAFAAQTSLVPFGAIVTKRTKLDMSGWWWRALVAIGIYVLLVAWLHEAVMGVPALPPEMTAVFS